MGSSWLHSISTSLLVTQVMGYAAFSRDVHNPRVRRAVAELCTSNACVDFGLPEAVHKHPKVGSMGITWKVVSHKWILAHIKYIAAGP